MEKLFAVLSDKGWVKYPNRLTPPLVEKRSVSCLVAVDSVFSLLIVESEDLRWSWRRLMLLILILVECWTETPLAGVQIYQPKLSYLAIP